MRSARCNQLTIRAGILKENVIDIFKSLLEHILPIVPSLYGIVNSEMRCYSVLIFK